jgi:prephenate dehydrogenase/chorismate mutase/prephenate dehydrogenase
MTIPEPLRQIDRALIQLLRERTAVLASSGAPSIQEQCSSYQDLLQQSGVLESTWHNLVMGSMAALTSQVSSQPAVEPRQITVIGGHGIMGRFFAERLSAEGHEVRILEYNDWHKAEALLGTADLVLICVPLKATLAVIRKVAQYISPSTMVADVASIKAPIVQEMLANHPGPVIGLHPMFGTGVKSFLSQKVVVCPGRDLAAFEWLLDWMEAEGGQLITCTPEEHDHMMVAVQAIRHFATFSLGVFLAESGIDLDRSLEFASPIYRTQVNLISRLFAQDAALGIDIMLASEASGQAITQLVETSDRLAGLLNQGNRAALIAEFEAARSAFQSQSARSLQESNHTLSNLSTFLAASEVETTHSSPLLCLVQ